MAHTQRITSHDIRQPYKALFYIVLLGYNGVMIPALWSAGIMNEHVFPQPAFAIPYLPYIKWIAAQCPSLGMLLPFYLIGFAAIFFISTKLPGTTTVKETQHYHWH